MKAVNEITKFISNLTWNERINPNNLGTSFYFDSEYIDPKGIEVLVCESYYYVLEFDTKTERYSHGEGDDHQEFRSSDEIDSIIHIHKYNEDGERVEYFEPSEKESQDIVSLLPSLTELN